MIKTSIYPSVLAIQEVPESWDSRILALPVLVAGVHYDIWDGVFVPSMMLPIENISYFRSNFPVDVHLMVEKPSSYFSQLLNYQKVAAVAFHVECKEDIHENIIFLKNAGKRAWLAILDITPSDHLDPYLLEIDYVLVMTVKWWYSGTPFISEVLSKITEIHNKRPELPIIVDGWIGEMTLPLCEEAGATGAVMSSALFSWKNTSWLL